WFVVLLSLAVSLLSAVLVASAPIRTPQKCDDRPRRRNEQRGEQVPNLVECQWNEPRWRRCGMFGGGGDGQEQVRQQHQGGPAVPRGPGADLVLVQAGAALGGLEGLLDGPPAAGDANQHAQGDRLGCVAAVERQLTGATVAAD